MIRFSKTFTKFRQNPLGLSKKLKKNSNFMKKCHLRWKKKSFHPKSAFLSEKSK